MFFALTKHKEIFIEINKYKKRGEEEEEEKIGLKSMTWNKHEFLIAK